LSEHTKTLALRHYDVDIEVIPNGVLLRSGAAKQVSDPPRLIFAGRFQSQKNIPMLIELLGKVRDMQWQCELLGDGPDRQIVEELIRSHDLGSRVNLLGWVDGAIVEERLEASDLLLLTSRSEGLPVIGVQALASGLAILASDVGGLPDLVEGDVNGRLCGPNDLDCFEQALRWCLEDRERLLKMKQASRARAERFDTRKIAEQYEAVFEEAVQREV